MSIAAVKAARGAFEAGRLVARGARGAQGGAAQLADLVRDHTEELAVLESLDSGKTITRLPARDRQRGRRPSSSGMPS